MSELVRTRVVEHLVRLRLGAVAQRLDSILSAAARGEPTYLDFLDQLLAEETEAKQKMRVAMGIQIAHFPTIKTLEELDFKRRRPGAAAVPWAAPPPAGPCPTA